MAASTGGTRCLAGGWITDYQGWGLEGSFFVMESATKDFSVASSGAAGTPAIGRPFTDVVSGQPPVRNFTQPAQDFSFGVCQSGISSPICAVDPNTVPTVMDTITYVTSVVTASASATRTLPTGATKSKL